MHVPDAPSNPRRIAALLATALYAFANLPQPAVAAAAARSAVAPSPAICVDSSSPSAALDRRVALAALHAAGVSAAVNSYDGSAGVSERFFRFLARRQCALVMGFPVDALAPDPPSGLALTAPYAQTGYVLAAIGAPQTLRSLPKGAVIAVGMATTPNFYLVGSFGKVPPYKADVYQTQEQALDALVRGEARYAMVWAPSVARYRALHPSVPPLGTSLLPFPHAAWSLAALYAPSSAPLARRFETGVARLRADGTLLVLTRSAQPESAK